jgi:hypothetical protein
VRGGRNIKLWHEPVSANGVKGFGVRSIGRLLTGELTGQRCDAQDCGAAALVGEMRAENGLAERGQIMTLGQGLGTSAAFVT